MASTVQLYATPDYGHPLGSATLEPGSEDEAPGHHRAYLGGYPLHGMGQRVNGFIAYLCQYEKDGQVYNPVWGRDE
jgi:hypothetical protein